MNDHYYLFLAITLISAALPCVAGMLRFRFLDLPVRIFFALMVVGFITEVMAFIVAKNRHNNMPVYNISSLVQIMLTCLYFNYAIVAFRRKKTGWYFGGFCVLVGVANLVIYQPLYTPNTYYASFLMVVVVLLSLTLIREELQRDIHDNRVWRTTHFWLSFLLATMAILNVLNASLYDFLLDVLENEIDVVNGVMVGICAVFNIAFAVVFFLHPKTIRDDGTR